jgi:phosphotransferase system  glucose/maltose/N-acetylglucosamine-specific IIC component
MFLQDAPPDTSSYMIAGYAVFFFVTAIYLFSFFVRSRNLNQDLNTLESIKEESKQTPAKAEAKPVSTKKKAKSAASKSKPRQVKKKATKKK